MHLLKWRSGMIRFFQQKRVLTTLYLLFILIFFIAPNRRCFADFYYVLIVPVFLICLRKNTLKFFLSSALWRMALAFLGYLLLTMLWEKDPAGKEHIYYIRSAIYLFIYFSLTMELVFTNPRFMEKLFVLLAWLGAATAVVSIVYCYHGAPVLSTRLEYLAEQLSNPVLGAIIYGMIALIIYFYIIRKSTDGSRHWRYGILLAIVSGSVLMTQSRGPLAVLLITFMIGGLLTRDKKLLITLGGIMAVGLTLFLSTPSARQMVTERGISYRTELAEKTWRLARDHLFFGKGITTRQQIIADDGQNLHHPHNIYLGMILYGGITGLFILLLLLAAGFREGLRHYLLTGDITLFILALFGAGTIITSQDKLIIHPHPLWFSFWLPLGLLAGVAVKNRAGISEPGNFTA